MLLREGVQLNLHVFLARSCCINTWFHFKIRDKTSFFHHCNAGL